MMFIDLQKENSLWIARWKKYFILDNQLDWVHNRVFHIPENAKVTYLLLASAGKQNIEIELDENWAELDLRVLFVWSAWWIISSKVKVTVSSSYSFVNFYTVSLLADWSTIDFDGWIVIDQWVINSKGYLLEENIMLWDNVKMKTLPLLDVHSNEIKASHGAKIHRLNKEKLFYLQSKWISFRSAKKIFVEAYINKVFEKIEDIEDVNHKKNMENLKKTLLTQIIL